MHATIQTPEEQLAYDQLVATCKGNEALAEAEWIKAEELARCQHEFWYFCCQYLGYHQMSKEHQALCNWMQAHPHDPKLILMPRYSFKSSIATVGYALWCLLKNPNERILIYSDTTEKAQGFLLEIKNHLMGLTNDGMLRMLLGAWEVDPQQQSWNQSAIVIKARTQAQREPSIDTAGIETSKVGMHYDRILFDDIVSDKNVTTKDQMDKVWECYTKSLSLLKPGGDVVMTGTRWHFGDLYGRLLAEDRHRGKWQVVLRKAEEGGRYPFADIGLTEAFLAEKRETQKSRLYSCLYQNEPTDAEDQLFKVVDFRFYQPVHNESWQRWVQSLYITAVLDAIPPPTSDHGDDAAITVVGTDTEHTMYLLEAMAGRWSPEDQIRKLLALHETWHFRKVGLETNAFQQTIKVALERDLMALRARPSWRPFSIESFTGRTQGNKESRIEGLEPYHRRGMLKFPGTSFETLQGVYADLAYQMIQFPNSPKDDLLDSLAYHVQIHQAGYETPQRVEYPVTSAAWFERELQKEEVLVMARRPRWTRQPVPELSFS